jgi:hypothetical protein
MGISVYNPTYQPQGAGGYTYDDHVGASVRDTNTSAEPLITADFFVSIYPGAPAFVGQHRDHIYEAKVYKTRWIYGPSWSAGTQFTLSVRVTYNSSEINKSSTCYVL